MSRIDRQFKVNIMELMRYFFVIIITGMVNVSEANINNFTDWTSTPIYSTFGSASSLDFKEGELGFGTSNFCIWGRPEDTLSYDTRTVDIFGRLGIGKKFEIEWRYGYPKAGRIALKKQLLSRYIKISPVLGFGYMKCSMREDSIYTRKWLGEKFAVTYYMFDFYGELRFGKEIAEWIELITGVRYIHSFYYEENKIDEYNTKNMGGFIALSIGTDKFRFIPEVNHYYGSTLYRYKYDHEYRNGEIIDKTIKFKVMNFGMGFIYKP